MERNNLAATRRAHLQQKPRTTGEEKERKRKAVARRTVHGQNRRKWQECKTHGFCDVSKHRVALGFRRNYRAPGDTASRNGRFALHSCTQARQATFCLTTGFIVYSQSTARTTKFRVKEDSCRARSRLRDTRLFNKSEHHPWSRSNRTANRYYASVETAAVFSGEALNPPPADPSTSENESGI